MCLLALLHACNHVFNVVCMIIIQECECIGIEGNPFTNYDGTGIISRNEPSLRRTLSVRGQLFIPRSRVREN